MKSKILIIDDNKSVLTALDMLLQAEFDAIFTLSNPNGLISAIQQHNIDVVLLDMNFQAGINTGNEGIYWLNQILSHDPLISVIMITAYQQRHNLSTAMHYRAYDFISKPIDFNDLKRTMHKALTLQR